MQRTQIINVVDALERVLPPVALQPYERDSDCESNNRRADFPPIESHHPPSEPEAVFSASLLRDSALAIRHDVLNLWVSARVPCLASMDPKAKCVRVFDPEFHSHSDQIGNRLRFHLFHDLGAVDLQSYVGDT
jgi:hypothetical protein